MMKSYIVAVLALVVLAGLSCTENNPRPANSGIAEAWQPVTANPGGLAAVGSAGQPVSAAQVDRGEVAPPKDARYTIYCLSDDGPENVMRMRSVKEQVEQLSGFKGWHLMHDDQQSTLYYGYYRVKPDDKSDRREAERAAEDLKKVTNLADAGGQRLFIQPMFQELESAGPAAPAAWDLRNAKGYWTLLIAAYVNVPDRTQDRKQAAVDSVRKAREMGIEAYYHHGPSVSEVCIGTWPRDAVKPQERADARTTPADPTRTIVVSTVPLPEGLRDANGDPVEVMQQVVEVQDPALLKTMKEYPVHHVNNYEVVHARRDPRTGRLVKWTQPSALVIIPNIQERDQQGSGAAPAPGQRMGPPLVQPPTPGMERLRSIGE